MRIGSALFTFVAPLLAAVSFSTVAAADVQHVVGKGHTLEAIAHRYHVTVQSIIDANHLKDPKHLKIGEVLTIPKVDPKKVPGQGHDEKDGKDGKKDAKAKIAKDAKDAKDAKETGPTTYAAKAKTPGVLHIHRAGFAEELDLKISDGGGKVSASTSKTFEKLLRSPSGASHPIEGRLISLLGTLSNHFGSRKIEVVSGFRPYTPTQYTAHSNHNHGKAIDFRVIGVPNEAVRDFCRTLRNVGCGYYPNSTFVHMDVRETSTFWIDYSKPGEPPHYNVANVDADEGTSDVHSDVHPSANTPPPSSANEKANDETPPGATSTPSESEPPPATKPTE